MVTVSSSDVERWSSECAGYALLEVHGEMHAWVAHQRPQVVETALLGLGHIHCTC